MKRTAFVVVWLVLGVGACGSSGSDQKPVVTTIDPNLPTTDGQAADGSDEGGVGVLCAYNLGPIQSCAAAPTAVHVRGCPAPLECLSPQVIQMALGGQLPGGWGCCTAGVRRVGSVQALCVFNVLSDCPGDAADASAE